MKYRLTQNMYVIAAVGSFAVLFTPLIAFAQLVPCEGTDCNFGHLVQLINNVINWAILVAPFLAGVAFAAAGFLYFSSRGNPDQVKRAHEIFQNTFIGLVLVVAAWLIVKTILAGLGAENILSRFFNR